MINLKENKISSEIIYQGSLLDVRRDQVRLPNGNTSSREWIKHPGAVCIIPQLPDNRIALIRQYRYPVQKEMIELPAGKLEENEKQVGDLEEKCNELKEIHWANIQITKTDSFVFPCDLNFRF